VRTALWEKKKKFVNNLSVGQMARHVVAKAIKEKKKTEARKSRLVQKIETLISLAGGGQER